MWDFGKLLVFFEDEHIEVERGTMYRIGPWVGKCLLNIGKVHIMWRG
jgi:hypothetical protein